MAQKPLRIHGVRLHESVTADRVVEAVERSHWRRPSNEQGPFRRTAPEPTARCRRVSAKESTCEACEAPGVYGAAELLIYLAV